jgi:hypothetical protein
MSDPILPPDCYGDIRVMLGLAPDDDDMLSDDVIESRLFLGRVTRVITPMLTAAGLSLDEDDETYDETKAEWVLEAATCMTAGLLAARWALSATADQVKSESTGGVSVSYGATPDWKALAQTLGGQAMDALGEALGVALDAFLPEPFNQTGLMVTAGPTRYAADNAEPAIADILKDLGPEVLRGLA